MQIRLAAASDGAALADIYRPAVLETPISFEIDPPDGAEMTRRVAAIGARLPWLVMEEPEGIAGYAYAGPHRVRVAYQWSVEVSAYVRPAAQRRGVAAALYTSLFAVLALQGFRNAYAGITLPNPASVAFHEALGFRAVGVYHGIGYKLGQWHDVGWWERALAVHVTEPPPPTGIHEVSGTAAFEAALAAGQSRVR